MEYGWYCRITLVYVIIIDNNILIPELFVDFLGGRTFLLNLNYMPITIHLDLYNHLNNKTHLNLFPLLFPGNVRDINLWMLFGDGYGCIGIVCFLFYYYVLLLCAVLCSIVLYIRPELVLVC